MSIENVTPKFSKKPIKIVGCGLAGAEIAFILANNGFDVHIFDNELYVPKDKFDYYDKYETYLTENMLFELDCLHSPLFSIAKRYDFKNFGFEYDETFMHKVRQLLKEHIHISLFDASIDTLTENETTIIATGHNTTKPLLNELEKYIGKMRLCYFQPVKMVIDANGIDREKLNFVTKSLCYANLSKQEYDNLYQTIVDLDKNYNKLQVLEQEKQITIESLSGRGQSGLRNSILRPYFDEKIDIERNLRPYASLKMTYNESENVFLIDDFFSAFDNDDQEKVISQIDVLKNAKVVRFSRVKRNTYLLAPACLNESLQIDGHENIYVCGGLLGTGGSFESLLMANYCAYSVICELKGVRGSELLQKNTCIEQILNNLLKKSVVNFRLFNLKYDIINNVDIDLQNFRKQVEVQKILTKSQVEKFKERFYGKYF